MTREHAMLANTDPALRTRVARGGARATRSRARRCSVRLLGDDWVLVRLPDGARRRTTLAAFVDRCPHRLAPLSAGCGRRRHAALRLPRLVLRRRRALHRDPVARRAASTCRRAPRRDHARPGSPSGTAWCSSRREPPVTELLDVPEADDPAFMHGALEPITRARRRRAHDRQLPRHGALPVRAPGDDRHAGGGRRSSSRSTAKASACACTAATRSRTAKIPGVAAGIRPLIQERVLEYRYRAPFSICLRIDYVRGGRHERARLLRAARRRRALPHLHDRAPQRPRRRRRTAWPKRVAFERKIIDEDLALQERYVDRRLPLDLTDRGAREGRPHDDRAAPHPGRLRRRGGD